jgi:hypothetical protein
MQRSIIVAAVGSVLMLAGLSQAAFTISALPSAQAAPAGKFALDLFARNDAGGTDGSNLQAVKINFTGTGGTRAFFFTEGLANGTTPETYATDQYNFGAGTSGTNVTDLGSSNLRIGTRTLGQHAMPNYPGDEDSPLTPDQAANGVSSFTADYAVLSAAISVPTPTSPGARFARLVFNTQQPFFSAVVTLAGETGPGVDYTYSYIIVDPGPATILPTPPTSVVFGPVVSNGQTFSVQVKTTSYVGDTVSLLPGAVAGITGLSVSRTTATANDVQTDTFTVTGNVAYSLNMTTVSVPFSVTNQGIGGPAIGSFQLIVTPEPASLAMLSGVAVLGAARRRR